MKASIIACLAIGLLSTSGFAQPVRSSYDLTLEGAREIMAAAVAYSTEAHAPGGAIAIVDAAGTLILFERINGTFPISSEVSLGKARSAALFRFPTVKLEDSINQGRPALISTGEVALKGGVPITYQGTVIGGIGVSGAASADQDVEIALAGLTAGFLKDQITQ